MQIRTSVLNLWESDLGLALILMVALCQSAACQRESTHNVQANARPDLTGIHLPECPATRPDTGWRQVELAGLGTMRVPPEARRATGDGRVAWILGTYGGVSYFVRSQDQSRIRELAAGLNRDRWCIGQGGDYHEFLARVAVGHIYTSFGKHIEAVWPLPDGRELVLSGVTDTAKDNLLFQIIRTVRLNQ